MQAKRQERKQIALMLVLTLVLALMLVAMPAAPAQAMSGACERFSSCSGFSDCGWWGLRCSVTNPFDFMDVMQEEYF